VIYFIQRPEGGPIKIGTAIDVNQRVKGLSTQYKSPFCILGVMKGDRIVEASLHDRFGHLRLEGEWFEPDVQLTCFITHFGKRWKGRDDIETNGVRNKTQIAFNVDLEVWQRIKDHQKETGATVSTIANRILLAWFRAHPEFKLPQLKKEA
jgi:Meiotically up-regulated gene 113